MNIMKKPSIKFERWYHSYHSNKMHIASIFKGAESVPERVIKTGNLFYTPSYMRVTLTSRKRRYYNYLISQL